MIWLNEEHQWLTSNHKGMQLFVRECYPRMFALATDIAKQNGGGLVFTGNPGIGKSWFLNYALWKLLQDNKTVLFESVSKNTLWLFKDGKVEMTKPDEATKRSELYDAVKSDQDAWYLFDPGEIAKEPIEIAPFTIVSASPNPKHYKKLEKLTANKYYVPCWSWEELEKHLPHAAKTIAPGLTVDEAKQNFDIFGGIPRYVYRNKDQVETKKEELLGAIHQLDLRVLALVRKDLEIVQAYHPKLSHKILQYDVDPESFKSRGIRFASNYVVDRVAEHTAETNLSELGRTLSDLKGPLAGELFERFAPSSLCEGGRFRTYSLDSGGKMDWLTMPPRSELRYVSSLSALKQWDEIRPDEFVKCAPNFPVVDALAQEGLFNYTVSRTHGINANACRELLIKLGVGKDKPLRLYWVVKDGEGKNFPRQKIEEKTVQKESKGESSTAAPRCTEEPAEGLTEFIDSRVSQFALEIPTMPYEDLGVSALRQLCKKKGLIAIGNKTELIARLKGEETRGDK